MKTKKNYIIAAFIGSIFLVSAYTKFNLNQGNSRLSSDEILIKGSDTELEMIKTITFAFLKDHPESKPLKTTGGGSSVGIESLLNGEAHVANSSRKMTKAEYEQALMNNMEIIQAIVAVDALAIITNSKLGVDSLSVNQVKDIFTGKITNWKEVGGPDLTIKCYGRNNNSGTFHYMQENVLAQNFSASVEQLSSTTAIIDTVKKNRSGIGYVGVGYLINKEGKPRSDVWATYLYHEGEKAYSPYELKSVEKGDYPIIRPLYQYYASKPEGDLKDFLQFLLNHKGQRMVRDYGYFPINSYHKQINLDNDIIINYDPGHIQ